jgi:hypothetical protein
MLLASVWYMIQYYILFIFVKQIIKWSITTKYYSSDKCEYQIILNFINIFFSKQYFIRISKWYFSSFHQNLRYLCKTVPIVNQLTLNHTVTVMVKFCSFLAFIVLGCLFLCPCSKTWADTWNCWARMSYLHGQMDLINMCFLKKICSTLTYLQQISWKALWQHNVVIRQHFKIIAPKNSKH